MPGPDAVDELQASGKERRDLVAVVVALDIGVALATRRATILVPAETEDPAAVVQRVDNALRPRWVMWSNATAVSTTARAATGMPP